MGPFKKYGFGISAPLVLGMVCLAILFAACRISYKFNGAALDYTVYKTFMYRNFPSGLLLFILRFSRHLKMTFLII